MKRDFESFRPDERLDLVDDVMQLGRVRHMLVVERGRLVGVVSQRDLLAAGLSRVLAFDPDQRRAFLRTVEVGEVMSRELLTVAPDATLAEAARLMIRHKIGCLPVLEDGERLVGMITETDLLLGAYGEGTSDAA